MPALWGFARCIFWRDIHTSKKQFHIPGLELL